MKVLLVDDSAPDRKLLHYYFKREGWETAEAENGREALDMIRQSPPDLIISDALMPEMDGFQLLREVKKMAVSPPIPFVVYSSTYMEERDRELGLALGADAFIAKAKGPDEFWQELKEVLEHRKAHQKVEIIDEEQYLSKYSNVLLRKLEEKVEQLEQTKARMDETERRLELDISQRRILMAQVHYLNEELEKRNVAAEKGASQTREELEALSPTFFEDLFAPLREVDELCRDFLRQHPVEARAVGGEVEAVLLALRSLPALLDELLPLPKIPRARLHAPLKRARAALAVVAVELPGGKCEAFLSRLRHHVEQMEFHLEDVLDLVRVKHVEMHQEPLDLVELVREIERELRNSQPERTVEFVLPQSLPAWGDPHLLRIALENLMENAWMHTSGVSEVVIELGDLTAGGEVTFFLRDNGPGFDPGEAEHLFLPFHRNGAEHPGTGIGLPIVQAVIERHGGTIRAEGKTGEGATFFFTLSRGG